MSKVSNVAPSFGSKSQLSISPVIVSMTCWCCVVVVVVLLLLMSVLLTGLVVGPVVTVINDRCCCYELLMLSVAMTVVVMTLGAINVAVAMICRWCSCCFCDLCHGPYDCYMLLLWRNWAMIFVFLISDELLSFMPKRITNRWWRLWENERGKEETKAKRKRYWEFAQFHVWLNCPPPLWWFQKIYQHNWRKV